MSSEDDSTELPAVTKSAVLDAEGTQRGRSVSIAAGALASSSSRTVVLAVDSSENARFAFEWYVDNVYRIQDHVVLAHCQETPKLPSISLKSGFSPPVDEWKKIIEENNKKTRSLEDDYHALSQQKKLRFKIRSEPSKNPGAGLIKIAEDEKAALIVVGTRGAGGVKRLLGSVSDYVVRNTTIPVLVIPAKKMRRMSLLTN